MREIQFLVERSEFESTGLNCDGKFEQHSLIQDNKYFKLFYNLIICVTAVINIFLIL